jgi:nucleoside-diphosphate-sugar epimerase
MSEQQHTYLVTGALGCIGAWTAYHLLRQGERVVSFDLSDQGHRLDLLLSREQPRSRLCAAIWPTRRRYWRRSARNR